MMSFALFVLWVTLTFGQPAHCYTNTFDNAADFCVMADGAVIENEEER